MDFKREIYKRLRWSFTEERTKNRSCLLYGPSVNLKRTAYRPLVFAEIVLDFADNRSLCSEKFGFSSGTVGSHSQFPISPIES
jgi:hypothetical protein